MDAVGNTGASQGQREFIRDAVRRLVEANKRVLSVVAPSSRMFFMEAWRVRRSA